MTNKLTRQGATDEKLEVFPDFGPRDDMQNYYHLYLEGHPAMLIQHFSSRENTVVMGEVPIDWHVSRTPRIPDLAIAFNVKQSMVISSNGYSIEEQGKPPDFVLEVASVTTARNDYTRKREDYAAFGIPEYWRFDPTGGRRYDAPLAGDRLVEGVYQPIGIVQVDDERLRGHSDVLNLDLCWEYGRLRWWDPLTQQYLRTHEEETEGRVAAEANLDAALARVRELEEELRRRSST